MVVLILTVTTVHWVSIICNAIFSIVYYISDTSVLINRVCKTTGVAYPIVGTVEDYGFSLISNVTSCPMAGPTTNNCNFGNASCDSPNNIVTCFEGTLF